MMARWFMARAIITHRGSERCGIARPSHGAMAGTIAGSLGGDGASGSGLVAVMLTAVFGIHPDPVGDSIGTGTIMIGTEAGVGDMMVGPERPVTFTTATASTPTQVHSATANGPMDTVMPTIRARANSPPASSRGYKILSTIHDCRCPELVWEGIGFLPRPIKELFRRQAPDSSAARVR